MRNINFIAFAMLLVIGVTSCCNKKCCEPKAVSTEVLKNIAGSYCGIIPAADCPGIETELLIGEDGTGVLKEHYIDRGDKFFMTPVFLFYGKDSTVIALCDTAKVAQKYFKIGENKLTMLDTIQNEILSEHNYLLVKVNKNLVEKEWKLLELQGDTVVSKRAFLQFNPYNNTVSGCLGVNRLKSTPVEFSGENNIKFGMIAATLMMGINEIDNVTENKFSKIFPLVNNFSVEENILLLNQDSENLAKFVFVK